VLAVSGYNSQNPYLGGPTAILTGNGGPVSTVIAVSTPFSIAPINPNLPPGNGNLAGVGEFVSAPGINDLGTTVGYGGSGIFISKDSQLTNVAASNDSGIFKHFTSDVALNNSGEVAFDADLNGGGNAIFTVGSDLIPHQVIAVGDALAGSTVTTLFVSHEGLNDAGDLAFDALLADGSQRVFRATAIPQSVSSAISVPESSNEAGLFGIAILGAIGYRWRRRAGDAFER
jgi:hypothetical protein